MRAIRPKYPVAFEKDHNAPVGIRGIISNTAFVFSPAFIDDFDHTEPPGMTWTFVEPFDYQSEPTFTLSFTEGFDN